MTKEHEAAELILRHVALLASNPENRSASHDWVALLQIAFQGERAKQARWN